LSDILTLWVALCMLAGLAPGKRAPSSVDALRSLEFGRGSQVSLPIAVLIWLMMVPMMMKVDVGSILRVPQPARSARHPVRELGREAIRKGADWRDTLPPRVQRLD
jgi:ACR3 family arsenite efflux pump ArsB